MVSSGKKDKIKIITILIIIPYILYNTASTQRENYTLKLHETKDESLLFVVGGNDNKYF